MRRSQGNLGSAGGKTRLWPKAAQGASSTKEFGGGRDDALQGNPGCSPGKGRESPWRTLPLNSDPSRLLTLKADMPENGWTSEGIRQE
ncbi:hypothetical protein R1flu_010363 [Riccia fluitans]|uniref:Uncharacterized protein n=1 Tax=Riccia fluitans TaxID=41844 RepID=A0ABD1Z4S0_9MARC